MTNTSEKYERTQQGNMLVLTMTTVVVKMLTMTNWEVKISNLLIHDLLKVII